MLSSKVIFRFFSIISILFFLTSILTVELQQLDGCSKLKYPVCVDSGVELATNGQHDRTFSGFDTPHAIEPPEAGSCISQLISSFHKYRGPPVRIS